MSAPRRSTVRELMADLKAANTDLRHAMDRLHRAHNAAGFLSVRGAIGRQQFLLEQLRKLLAEYST